MNTLQKFDEEYLKRCRELNPDSIVKFLEDFRQLHADNASSGKPTKSKLISLKVPEVLLGAFKAQAQLQGVKYQTQIKALMREWLTIPI